MAKKKKKADPAPKKRNVADGTVINVRAANKKFKSQREINGDFKKEIKDLSKKYELQKSTIEAHRAVHIRLMERLDKLEKKK